MIQINQKDRNFILANLTLTELDRDILKKERAISEDFADKLRDLCLDELDYRGYNEKYEPTKIGKELNKLIDKLYAG